MPLKTFSCRQVCKVWDVWEMRGHVCAFVCVTAKGLAAGKANSGRGKNERWMGRCMRCSSNVATFQPTAQVSWYVGIRSFTFLALATFHLWQPQGENGSIVKLVSIVRGKVESNMQYIFYILSLFKSCSKIQELKIYILDDLLILVLNFCNVIELGPQNLIWLQIQDVRAQGNIM